MWRTVRKVAALLAAFWALASLSGGAGEVFGAVRGWLSTGSGKRKQPPGGPGES
jgi:ABC-type xylose transport system permease subunit